MPEMGRILSPQQIWALVAFLESQGGTVDVKASDILLPLFRPGANSGRSGARDCWWFTTHDNHPGRVVPAVTRSVPKARHRPNLTHVGSRLSAALIRNAFSSLIRESPKLREVRRYHAENVRQSADRRATRRLVQFLSSQNEAYLKHPFWQAALLLVLAYIVIAFIIRCCPAARCAEQRRAAVHGDGAGPHLIWVSGRGGALDEVQGAAARCAHPARLKVVRTVLLAAVTLIVGCFTYRQVRASVAAPPNLRSIHPAPPVADHVPRQDDQLVGLDNPLRRTGDMAAQLRRPRVYYQNACRATGTIWTAGPLSARDSIAAGQLPDNRHDRAAHRELRLLAASPKAGRGCPARERRGIRRCRHGKTS